MKPGESLQRLVEHLERILSSNDEVTIESPKRVPDNITGRSREHDVVLTMERQHHRLEVAIECRDRKRKIGSPDVEAFWAKCQDTCIDQGIMVSSVGFTKPAVTKAKMKGIRCLTIEQATSFNWLLTDAIQTYQRMITKTSWTVFPHQEMHLEQDCWELVDQDGSVFTKEILNKNAERALSKIGFANVKKRAGRHTIKFPTDNLFIRMKDTKELINIKLLVLDIEFDVETDSKPFELITYADQDQGKIISEVAVAKFDLGGVKGKIMVVYKEEEGGQVVFIPDQTNE